MSQLRRQVKMSPSSPFHLFHSPIIGRGKGAQKVKKKLALLLKREMSFWESQNLQESTLKSSKTFMSTLWQHAPKNEKLNSVCQKNLV